MTGRAQHRRLDRIGTEIDQLRSILYLRLHDWQFLTSPQTGVCNKVQGNQPKPEVSLSG